MKKIPDHFYQEAYQLKNSGNSQDVLVWNMFQKVMRKNGNNGEAQNIIMSFLNSGKKLSQGGQKFVDALRGSFSDNLQKNSEI